MAVAPKQWQFESTITFQPTDTVADASRRHSKAQSTSSTTSAIKLEPPTGNAGSSGSPNNTSPANPVGFSFVNVAHPNEAKQLNSKRAIRSHVAKVQHSRSRQNGTRVKKTKSNTAARTLQPRTLEPESNTSEQLAKSIVDSIVGRQIKTEDELLPPIKCEMPERRRSLERSSASESSTESAPSFAIKRHDSIPEEDVEEINRNDLLVQSGQPAIYDPDEDPYAYVADAAETLAQMSTAKQKDSFLYRLLSDGRKDPFWSYPIPHHPELEPVIDHYLVNILVDVDFLIPKGAPGMRSRWFPLSMTEPAIFWAVTLVAAAHFNFVNHHKLKHAINLFALKQKAIEHINEALADPQRSLSDATLGAVMKLASYEAMWGDAAAYETHMSGLQQLVLHRGGLANLGLDGLMERTVLWIDSNGSSAIGCGWKFDKRWFPTIYTHPPTNPAHFTRMAS